MSEVPLWRAEVSLALYVWRDVRVMTPAILHGTEHGFLALRSLETALP